MLCTFCGTENRPENKFCGMCGVRMDRRQAERRGLQTPALRCPSCGHVNEAGHKFCGMCGGRREKAQYDAHEKVLCGFGFNLQKHRGRWPRSGPPRRRAA
jgi:NADH pyrophosphatase NudC (nudix superfamily)